MHQTGPGFLGHEHSVLEAPREAAAVAPQDKVTTGDHIPK